MMKSQSFRIAVLLSCLICVLSLPAWGDNTITVTGESEIKVAPDEVILTLGVTTQDKELAKAKLDNDARVKVILAAATKFGIDPKYVQTDCARIEPTYKRGAHHEPIFSGYLARKEIVITLKDISKFEDLLSAVLQTGANNVSGVQFLTTQLRKYRDQARVLAARMAAEKAALLAGELGRKLGKALTISEQPSYERQRHPYQMQVQQSYAVPQSAVEAPGGAGWSGDTTVAPVK